MKTRYQWVILAPNGSVLPAQLAATVKTRVEDLGLNFTESCTIFFRDTASSADSKAPTVCVYFGSTDSRAADRELLAALLIRSTVIIPVVTDLLKFTSFVPIEISHINGMQLESSDPNLEAVAAATLEALHLLRHTRRLFISYKRRESRAVAIQLYEKLDASGFDVFLDTHSIQPGEPFQDILWHRMADIDVMVLLDTPGFLSSRWTEAELAEANSRGIGILQVVWPEHVETVEAALSHFFQLEHADFIDGGSSDADINLKEEVADKIVSAVESLRARSLAARHAYLVEEFCREAGVVGLTAIVQPERYIEVESGTGKTIIAIPAVGVPDARRYQEIEERIIANLQQDNTDAVLVYDHRGIRDRWVAHLRWLDDQLRIKSLKVSDASRWLSNQ